MKRLTIFFILWAVIFVASYAGLSALGLVPPEVDEFNYRTFEYTKDIMKKTGIFGQAGAAAENDGSAVSKGVSENILPTRIVIDKIGVDAPIVNPETRDSAVLDNALMSGAVRYPGSGGLDDSSNMFIFGHSTTFAVVHHLAYKTFNHLDELADGDLISVFGDGKQYVYSVDSVETVDTDVGEIMLGVGEKKLTLTTCDTFGGNAKTKRVVVEATFVNSIDAVAGNS